jgi:hypothetical protein
MATSAQIAANRANAQKSTGPRSAEGKSASRFNALKHGIDANTELRRARTQAEPAPEGSFDKYLDFLCAKRAPGELASFPQSAAAPPMVGHASACQSEPIPDAAPAVVRNS